MTIFESVIVALEAIIANRLRSSLTMLGIIFGVGAVIAAVSLTEGAKRATLERFERMGTNTLTIRPGQASRGPIGGGVGSQNTLTLDDADAIVKRVPEVIRITPQVNGRAQVDGGGTNTNTLIIGTTAAELFISSYQMADGEFFTDDDVERNKKVAVLGATVTKNLFGDGAKVAGRRIRIKGTTFRVAGQYASKGAMGFRDPDDQILIPFTTAVRNVVGSAEGSTRGKQTVSAIVAQVKTMDDSAKAQNAIKALLRERHGLSRGQEDDFMIWAVADVVEGAQEANKIMTLLFSSIAAVSLIVGGIGIMNIMLVSVTERTREIGLRKSVGATPGNIMAQFLIESITLSLAGGLLGVLVGIGATPVVTKLGLNAIVSMPWVVISFIFAAVVGVVFGILPARKAANLDPVEALRYE